MKNIPALSSFVLGFQNVIDFHVRQLEIQKMLFKNDAIFFTCLFGHRAENNKDVALKVRMLVV